MPVRGLLRSLGNSWLHALAAVLLAGTFFAFQAELFDEEYEANHPPTEATPSITAPTTTWESFDKDNVLQAFVLDAGVRIECIVMLPPLPAVESPAAPPCQLVRDKSPPVDQES